MTGFVLLVLIGAGTAALLWRLGLPRPLWSLAGAALMLGAAGYAWQGEPGLPGVSARPAATAGAIDPMMIDLRERMMGRFTLDAAYLTAADAMARVGDRDAAAAVMLAGVRKLPRSYMLWTGLGSAMAARDGDQVSPAALLAFRRAAQLAPQHPAPVFYRGIAHARAGDPASAAPLLRRALALSPEGASYRRDIALFLAVTQAMDR